MLDPIVAQNPHPPSFSLFVPTRQTSPLVFASPHSGRYYPDDFLASSKLDAQGLRRSEDGYVDHLFASAPNHGAPLIAAHYARAYCDLNREPYELDPAMFSDPLPPQANIRSRRVAAGLGTIARTVGAGVDIYKTKLKTVEIERRLSQCYHPYHDQLALLVAQTKQQFGWCLLVDCHSMPSLGVAGWQDQALDMVLGDNHGVACSPRITHLIQGYLTDQGYRVALNVPYAGGFTTCHYGRPFECCHSIQIEINRGLYLDEQNFVPADGFDRVAQVMAGLVECLTERIGQWQGNPT